MISKIEKEKKMTEEGKELSEEAIEEIEKIKRYLDILGYNHSALERYDITDESIRQRMLSQLQIELFHRIEG
jgi:hypothetical protein